MKKLISVLVIVVGISGCASTTGSNQTGGTILGAGLGALVGSQFGGGTGAVFATVIGGLAGAAIGNNIGRQLDNSDRRRTAHALETIPTGGSVAWHNPDTGNNYRVVPTKTYQTSVGRYCREFIITDTTVGNIRQPVYGTACRQSDGSWKMD